MMRCRSASHDDISSLLRGRSGLDDSMVSSPPQSPCSSSSSSRLAAGPGQSAVPTGTAPNMREPTTVPPIFSTGRCSAVISSSEARSTARSITLRSSRMLPGHE
jgi:hypothetical protein